MPFTEKEKRQWHAEKKSHRGNNDQRGAGTCAHCGAQVDFGQSDSEFPLCAACDGD